MNRRSFLAASGALGAGAVLASSCSSDNDSSEADRRGGQGSQDSNDASKSGEPGSEDSSTSPFKKSPFTLGVASGDPLPDSVILWTRLAPNPTDVASAPSDDAVVNWELAKDPQFSKVLKSGTATAVAADAHSIHIDVEGLEPATEYYYRFKTGSWTSTVGRTKTTAAKDAVPEKVVFGFSSCQDYQTGSYLAHRAMAADALDAVVWLGDYIYEYAPDADAARPLTTSAPEDVDSYRNRYAEYRLDVDLQASHASAPWLVIWDDHETQNNYADLTSENVDTSTEDFAKRRTAAYAAWWEHMPVRMAKPTGPDLKIYKRVDFGNLMKMLVLDTRQYRDDQPCDSPSLDIASRCEGVDTTKLLGEDQLAWVIDELESGDESTWCVLAQQIMMGQLVISPDTPLLNLDQWDGYRAERQKLIDVMKPNTVVLAGDIHSSWVNDLKKDFDDPASAIVATEFVGPPTSSVFPDVFAAVLGAAQATNPHIRYVDATSHGYARCTITPEQWLTEYRYGDINDAQGAVTTAQSWTVTPDKPGAVDA